MVSKKMKKLALSLTLIAGLTSQAFAGETKAEDRNMWALGGVSMASTKLTVPGSHNGPGNNVSESSEITVKNTGLDMVYGWQFGENVGIEAGLNYQDDTDEDGATLSITTLTLAPAVIFQPTDHTKLIFKAGYAYHTADVEMWGYNFDLGSESAMILGAAAQYTLDYGFTVRAGYDFYANNSLGDVGSFNLLAGYSW